MSISDARLLSNRLNSLRSTGPRTATGRQASSRNSLKHGLTGSGAALPGEDQAEIAARFARYQAQYRPRTEAGTQHIRRYAYLSVRLERCERFETRTIAQRVRHAVARFDDERLAAVEALGSKIYSEPATSSRRLQMTPEGVDWLLNEWEILRGDLTNPARDCWTGNHRMHFDALLGQNPGGYRVGRVAALADAMIGNFRHLDGADGEGLDGAGRSAWARAELTRMLDDEVARLESLLASMDHESLAMDRAEAVDRVLFDPSKEATLARKYEAATVREMTRALREFREAEAVVEPEPDASPSEEAGSDPVASIEKPPEGDQPEADPAVPPTPSWPEIEPSAPTVLNISIGLGPEIDPGPAGYIGQV